MRFLYNFGVGPEAAGFNLFFFLSSCYLISFLIIHALIEFSPDHKYSILARTYFNFLNTIIGRGLFLIFMSLVLLEKDDQGEILIALIVIGVGIVDIILGWNQDKQEMPSLPWKSEGVSRFEQNIKPANSKLKEVMDDLNQDNENYKAENYPKITGELHADPNDDMEMDIYAQGNNVPQ